MVKDFPNVYCSISLSSRWWKVIDVHKINIVTVLFLQTCELVMGKQLI